MLTYKSRVSWNVFVSKKKKVGAWAATYTIFFIFFSLFHKFIYTNEAVLNIIAQASGITKLIFMRWKTRNPMSSPISEHENNRFWLFKDKFVIVEAVLNWGLPCNNSTGAWRHLLSLFLSDEMIGNLSDN